MIIMTTLYPFFLRLSLWLEERGTFESLFVTPVKPIEIIWLR